MDEMTPSAAVLLIDAQYDTRWGVHKDENVPHEKACMSDVLRRANARGVPVYEVIWPGQFETDPELASQRSANWKKFTKYDCSAFSNPALLADLNRRGVTDLILMGLYQERCVLVTAAFAARAGFRIHVAADVVQGWDASGLDPWYAKNATVAPSHKELPV